MRGNCDARGSMRAVFWRECTPREGRGSLIYSKTHSKLLSVFYSLASALYVCLNICVSLGQKIQVSAIRACERE